MPKILSTRTIRLCSASVLPLACVLSMPAAAQGVTLYGSVDAAVIVSNSGAPGASNAMGVTSGVLTPSRWGLRGSEALGGGTNAVFVLEAGLDTDTGAAKAYAGNPATATPTAPNGVSGTGFNRRSFVGLESRFGTLTIGRDYTPFYYTGLQTDPMGLTLFGNVQAITPLAGGSERWGRVSNAVFYTSPVIGGFKGRAAYSFGSESGGGAAGSLPKRANVFFGVGGDYVNGGLVVSGSYQKLNYPEVAGATPAFTGGVGKRTDASLGVQAHDSGSAIVPGRPCRGFQACRHKPRIGWRLRLFQANGAVCKLWSGVKRSKVRLSPAVGGHHCHRRRERG